MSSLIPVYTQVYKNPVSFSKALGYAYDALTKQEEFDAMAVWNDLSKRISQGIYMGSGLLLPHVRIKGLSQPIMAFAVAPSFTDIKIPSQENAQFLCVLLSPAESASAHTIAIAKVAKLILDMEWKLKVLKSNSSEELLQLFQ